MRSNRMNDQHEEERKGDELGIIQKLKEVNTKKYTYNKTTDISIKHTNDLDSMCVF